MAAVIFCFGRGGVWVIFESCCKYFWIEFSVFFFDILGTLVVFIFIFNFGPSFIFWGEFLICIKFCIIFLILSPVLVVWGVCWWVGAWRESGAALPIAFSAMKWDILARGGKEGSVVLS